MGFFCVLVKGIEIDGMNEFLVSQRLYFNYFRSQGAVALKLLTPKKNFVIFYEVLIIVIVSFNYLILFRSYFSVQ